MEPCKEVYLKAREKQLKHVYGKSSHPRQPDPSMRDIMKWEEDENEIWNYKTNNRNIIQENPFNKVEKSINQSKQNWVSESHDAYKGFFQIHGNVYDSVDPNVALPFSCDSCKPKKRSTSSKRRRQKRKGRPSSSHDHSYSFIDEDFVSSERSKPKKTKNIGHRKHIPIGDETKERLRKFHDQSKWIPNSSMLTYYGKVPFDNYGRANTKSKLDGFLYGNYMKSYNVNPHRGENHPQYYQTFNNTLTNIENKPELKPEPPRKVMEIYRLTDVNFDLFKEQVKELNSRSKIFPEKNKFDSQGIKKPKLAKTRRFNPDYFEEKKKRKEAKRLEKMISEEDFSTSRSRSKSKSHGKHPDKKKSMQSKSSMTHKKKMKDKKVQIEEDEEAGFLYSKGINDPRDREYNVGEYLEKKKESSQKLTSKINTNYHGHEICSKNERNPQFYSGKDFKDLERIPFAGKRVQREGNSNFLKQD